MTLKLLVSPLAKGAYFDAYLEVARAELGACLPGVEPELEQRAGLDLLVIDEPDPAALSALARLSFVQGAFRERDGSGLLEPLALPDELQLPEALVFGAKYQGKTNELVTQMALNVALRFCATGRPRKALLDPVAGRGTTLLWGLRYGLDATGLELDPAAPAAMHAHIKKQAKLHRLKHSHRKGFVGKKDSFAGKDRGTAEGAFSHYELGGRSLRLITGDSRRAPVLLADQRFDLLVGDLPYGVQHRARQPGSKAKSKGKAKHSQREGLVETIRACAEGWLASLREGGAMVLIFNSYQPTRAELSSALGGPGLQVEAFSAPHRMSESIVRDLLVVTRPA